MPPLHTRKQHRRKENSIKRRSKASKNGEKRSTDQKSLNEVYIIPALLRVTYVPYANSSTAFIIFLSEHRSFCGRYNSATDFAHADPDVAFIFKERALTEMREHEREVNPGPLAKKYKDRRIEIQAAQRKGRARFVVERERQRQKEWERKLRVQAKVFAAKMAEAERARLERERAEEARQRVLDQNEAQKRRHDEERGKVKSRLVKQGDFDWYDNDLELPTADGTVVGMKKSLWKRLKHCLRSR